MAGTPTARILQTIQPIELIQEQIAGLEEFDKLGRNARQAVLASLASLATFATGLNNASIYLCARGKTWLGCPATAHASRDAATGRSQIGAGVHGLPCRRRA